MITCFLEGKVAGNCQISFRSRMKDRRRASVAIAVLRELWSLGIAIPRSSGKTKAPAKLSIP